MAELRPTSEIAQQYGDLAEAIESGEQEISPEVAQSALPWGEFIGSKMDQRPVLIITALSRSHSLESRQAIHPSTDTEDIAK